MANTKTFQFDNGKVPFSADTELGSYSTDCQSVRVAGGNFLDELIESNTAWLTVFKTGNRVHATLTTGGSGEIAMPISMETRGKCSCGDPEPSNAGTEIVTGGPSPSVVADRVGDMAKAMDEIDLFPIVPNSQSDRDSFWTAAKAAERGSEHCTVVDVVEELDRRPVEPPKPAELLPTVSEPEMAHAGAPVAPEEPSGICLTSAVLEVPLGAAVNQ